MLEIEVGWSSKAELILFILLEIAFLFSFCSNCLVRIGCVTIDTKSFDANNKNYCISFGN